MKKILYIFSGLLSLILLIVMVNIFAFKCEKPDEITVSVIQIQCLQSVDLNILREELCQLQHGSTDCTLQDSDYGVAQKLLFNIVNECTKNTLKQQNKCIDNYKSLQ